MVSTTHAPMRRHWSGFGTFERDPGDIVSFAQLQALMQQHRAKVPGVSRDAEFLRWLMDREWNRLAPGSGYRKPLCTVRNRFAGLASGKVARAPPGSRKWV